MKKIGLTFFSGFALLFFHTYIYAQCNMSVTINGTTCAGHPLTATTFSIPQSIAWQQDGNTIHTEYASAWNDQYTVIAGGNGAGSADNQFGYQFQFINQSSTGIAMDHDGNLYICDNPNNRIQKWAPGATAGVTVAGGNGDGSGANQFSFPMDVFVDGAGNIYVADLGNYRVQKWTPGATAGVTVAGGSGGSAANQLDYPWQIFVDDEGSVYVSDALNYRIQKWAQGATSGVTVAGGNGNGGAANQISSSCFIFVDHNGNVFVSDTYNNRVQKWAAGATSGVTVAGGNGTGYLANQLNSPLGIYVDAGDNLFVTSTEYDLGYLGSKITLWRPGATEGMKVAGTFPDAATGASLWSNPDFTIDGDGNMIVLDAHNWRVLQFDISDINNTFSPPSAGNYQAVATGFDESCSAASNTITIDPAPVVNSSANGIMCGATDITLTATGGSSFTWQPGNLQGAVQTFAPTVTTTYSVTSDVNSCVTEATIPVLQGPSISISGNNNNCSGQQLTASISGSAAAVEWKKNGSVQEIDLPSWNGTAVTAAGGNGQGYTLDKVYAQYMTVDGQGTIYASDANSARITKWTPGASKGIVMAGGNGFGSASNQLDGILGTCLDSQGNLYVTEFWNKRVSKWAPGATSGITVAGGNGSGSALNQLSFPQNVALDAAGNLYVLDLTNFRVMKWVPGATEGVVVAGGNGDGSGSNQMSYAGGMYVSEGGDIYIADQGKVRKFAAGTNDGVTVLDGLGNPTSIWRDGAGYFYVMDHPYLGNSNYASNIIRFKNGISANVLMPGIGSGADQVGGQNNVSGGIDANGNLYILDFWNFRVQRYSVGTFNTATFNTTSAGDYTAVGISFYDCAISSNTISLTQSPTVAENVSICNGATANLSTSSNGTFTWNPGNLPGSSVSVTPTSTTTYTVTENNSGCESTIKVTVDPLVIPAITGAACLGSGNLSASLSASSVKLEWKLNGTTVSTTNASYNNQTSVIVAGGNGQGSALNQLNVPYGLCMDDASNLYIADYLNHRIVKWTPGATQGVVVAGGNGQGANSNQLNFPRSVCLDHHGNLFVSDGSNNRIQKFTPGSTDGVTVAGGNGQGSALNQLNLPRGIFVDDSGNIYVVDYFNNRVMKWIPNTAEGIVVAGGNGYGSASNQLASPSDVVVNGSGDIYVCDNGNHRIQKWTPGATSGITIAGDGTMGYGNVQLNYPQGIAFDGAGNLYIMNTNYNTIFKWEPGATSGTYMAGYCCSGTGSLSSAKDVCIGTDGSLYALDGSKVVKYSVNNIASTTYTPSSAGDYTLTAISFSGCSLTSNVISVYANPAITLTGNQYFCAGNSTTIDAGAHQQYLWSTNAATQTETFNSAGDYSVAVTDNGCSTTSNFHISQQTPSLLPSASPANICVGNTSTLNANDQAGVSPITYSWSPGGMTTANPTVTALSTTTYTVTATSLGCSSTSAVTVNVAVAPGDTAAFGDHVWNVYVFNKGGGSSTDHSWNEAYSGYYVDDNLNFNTTAKWPVNGTPSGASGYNGCAVNAENHSWSAKRKGFPCGIYQINIDSHDDMGQLFVNGVNVWEHNSCCDSHSNVWSGFLDDNSTVVFRVTEGGGGSQGAISFITASVLTANGPTTICPGYSSQLTANSADSYSWSTGEITQSIIVNSTGNYKVTISGNGCIRTDSIQINVAPMDTPVIYSYNGFNYCPINYGVDLSIDWNPRYNSVLWNSGETWTGIYVFQGGNYSVTVSDALGCSATSHATVIGPPGTESAFGNNVWKVNGYLYGDDQDYGYSWIPQDYSGYYIDSNLNFDSETKWDPNTSPYYATGYQGCYIYEDFMSWSAKRQGFPCGIYQVDVLNHDDEGQLFVDGVKVWGHIGAGDSHTNVWTGELNPNSKVEFRVTDGWGESRGALQFTLMNSIPLNTYYADADSDGFGDPNAMVQSCVIPSGYVINNTDCNDADHDAWQNGSFYTDADGDGYDAGMAVVCYGATVPSGYSETSSGTDCDDTKGSVHPGATELCNSIDDNCNGQIDENSMTATVTASGPLTFCAQGNVKLTANSGSGLHYQWLKDEVDISGATKKNYTAKGSGSYQVKETNNSGCNATSHAIVVDEVSKPSATITPQGSLNICHTGSIVLQANTGEGLTHQWLKGKANISGATNSSYTATTKGIYKVIVSNSTGCSKKSAGVTVTKSCKEGDESSDELPAVELNIYPNPTTGIFVISLNLGTQENLPVTIQLYNLIGQLVQEEKTTSVDGRVNQEIHLAAGAPAGLYLVRVIAGDEFYTRRLVIQK